MNLFTYRISLDIRETTSQAFINVKKNDTARKFIFTLTDNGRAYQITEGCTAVFRAKKPDGTVLYNNCPIIGNAIEYSLTSQTVAAVGIVECEITLYGSNSKQITSPRFSLVVDDVLYSDSEVESQDEFTALLTAISQTNNLNITAEKVNNDVIITITKKDGSKTLTIVERGPAGPDGFSPTVSVSEITGGHRVTITDAAGDHSFDVMDGESGSGSSSLLSKYGTVISQNADYAEVGEWADGNTSGENRIGYFVAVDDTTAGTTMVKATSAMAVRGVTVTAPAFSGNCSADKFDSNGDLLKQYDYVAVMGLVSVIDNGTCTINGRCMPNDNGTAVPSANSLGYHVIGRIDSTHILIAVEPAADMIQRIKTDVANKVDKVTGKGLSTNDYDDTAKAKVDAIPSDPKYTDTVYDDTALKNRVSTIEGKEASWDAKSDFSGSYNDLTDKPTIPAAVTDDHINSLIDAKLGVIENGSY